MKWLLSIIFLWCLTCNSWSAELLVLANDNPTDISGKKGDIVIVRDDGWKWGKKECLPLYIVVKLPGVKEEDAKKYEEPLTKPVDTVINGKTVTTQEMVQLRKYNIPLSTVDAAKITSSSVVPIDAQNVATFTASINEKKVPDGTVK